MRSEYPPDRIEQILRTALLVPRFFIFLVRLSFFIFWTTLVSFPMIGWTLAALTAAFLSIRAFVFEAGIVDLAIEAALFIPVAFMIAVPSYFTLWLFFSPGPDRAPLRTRAA